jgi:hypothetical protein
MKYIKKYKIFESNNNILEDLNDICLELKDSGLDVKIKENGNTHLKRAPNIYSILIERRIRDNYYFEFNSEIKETIIRVDQYMRELGYKTKYTTNYNYSENVFIIRPDEKLRYLNGLWIADNENVLDIMLIYTKKST